MNQSYPKHPGRVLGSAQYAGLAALVRLAKRRVTRDETVQSMCAGIDRMWRNVRAQLKPSRKDGLRNLTPLFNAEPNMRKNYLGMQWHSTIPYGNKEFKRVYRWSEGTIGPLNELFNFAGAQLRTLAMTQFPFPNPTYYQVREYSDGTTKTVPNSTAIKHPVKKGVNTKWIAIYPGNSGQPDVRVRHPTLPELDFVDMIRAHVYELCRQCFIHNVPRDAAYRYIRLLIHHLTPFLEWKYTEGDSGRKDFWPQADRELRMIVLDLRAVYSRRSGRTPRLTEQLTDERPERVSISVLEAQAESALARNNTRDMQRTIRTLRKLIKKKFITDYDATSLVDDALRIIATEGNRWHSVISNIGYQPNSLREVVFYGDKHHRELNDVLLAHEVPVTTPNGAGVADIVVFVRRVFGERVIWTPIMILDVKTKTQLDWTFFSRKPRTKKDETRVLVHYFEKRSLSKEEWDFVLDCTPSPKHELQLREYEEGIISGFEQIVHDKEIIPKSLWKGILVLDSKESYEDIVPILPWLIKAAISDLEANVSKIDSRTLYSPESKIDSSHSLKVALILSSRDGPIDLLTNRLSLPEVAIENPFEQRRVDERNLTLYLSVASPGSSGDSASWTARNWHLLEYLKHLSEQNNNPRIVWLDLMGYFPSTQLAMSRLRITGTLSPTGMPKTLLHDLCALVDGVEFVNFRSELRSYFYDEKRASLKRVREKLDAKFKKVEKDQIVIVDGWSELCKINPHRFDTLIRTLENRLLEWLPKNKTEIIWLDRPVPLPTRSLVYQRTEVSPLPHDSPRREHLDMIIWNKPTPPRFLGWRSPLLEFVRVIEHDTPTQTDPFSSLFLVPQLHGWGRRFRADSSEGRRLTESDVMERVHGPKYARGTISSTGNSFVPNDSDLQDEILEESLELSPSILRPRTDERNSVLISKASQQDVLISIRQMNQVKTSQGILDRLTLVPSGTPPRESDDDSKQYYPAKAITRARISKKKREAEEQERWTRRPPLLEDPRRILIGEREIRREVYRILRTAKFLRSIVPDIEQDWRRLLSDIVKVCKAGIRRDNEEKNPVDVLGDVKKILAKKKESRDIWKLLSDTRRKSTSEIASVNDKQKLISTDSEIWELFGNDLYLLILAIYHDDELEIDKSELEMLWSAFSDWQFTNMGFVPYSQPVNHVKSKYDISSIWSNLKWRAKQLGRIKPVLGIFEEQRFGLLVQVNHSSNWLIFRDKARPQSMIAGFTETFEWPFQWKWYECVIDPVQLEEESSKSWDQSVPIIITHNEGKDILWSPRVENDEIVQWWAEGMFEYGPPPKGKTAPLRWFKLSRIQASLRTRLVQPEVSVPEELEDTVKQTLGKLDGLSDDIRKVDCRVTINVDKEVYQVEFFDKGIRVSEPIHTLDIKNTTGLIQILKHPKITGTSFRNEFWWNPETDLEYSEIETERGPISLTFLKPFIYRSRRGSEFLRTITLPRTARDLLQTNMGDSITLVADPNLNQMKHAFAKYWRILFLQTELSERMLNLQNVDMNVIEIAQFFECEQFIDTTTGLRHPIKFAVNNAKQVGFPEDVFHYSMIAKYLSKKNIHANDENGSEVS